MVRWHLFFLSLLAFLVISCGQENSTSDYVVRVSDQYLTADEISSIFLALPPGQDTTGVRQQIIENWISQALLYEEAKRRKLEADPEIDRLLKDNEMSVLISALLNRLYDENLSAQVDAELEDFFELNKETLRLREPYVRLRYLNSTVRDSLEAARHLLEDALSTDHADSLWPSIIGRFAVDPDVSRNLSDSYHPESRLFVLKAGIHSAIISLKKGQISSIILDDGSFHLVQLVDRVPSGTVPQLNWIEDELRERLSIHLRKQLYARLVQNLRNEALSKEELEIR